MRIADLWFSGSTTTAVLEIRDVNKAFGGNDFGLDDLYMGTCAKGLVANDVTARTMSNMAPPTSIPALSATVTSGPAVASYTVQTLPAAASGILSLGGSPVIPGQVIPVAQANQLLFDPTAGYVGAVTFTYTASDMSGAGSNNTATYTVPVDGRPLPVELVSFEAKPVRKVDAQLNWRTASEKNNDHFDIERSTDGRTFERIGRVEGQGSVSTPTDYAYTDARIGVNAVNPVYYRLNQVDRDGSSSYSSVQPVRFAKVGELGIALFPNPTTALTKLDLSLLPAGTYQVRVFDNVGRVVLSLTSAGGTVPTLDLHTVANGTYIVLVQGSHGQQFAKRLVKE